MKYYGKIQDDKDLVTKEYVDNSIPASIQDAADTWLTAHITNPDSPPLDRSLSSSAAAAPADMVGALKNEAAYNYDEKTLTSSDISQGYWNNGVITSSNTRICSSKMYPVKAGDMVEYTAATLQLGIWIYYDGDSEATSLLSYTANSNGKILLSKAGRILFQLKKANNGNLTPSNYDATIAIKNSRVNKLWGDVVTNGLFMYYDGQVNRLHKLINYGYSDEVTDYPATSSDLTTGLSVGVKRYGVTVLLNYDGTPLETSTSNDHKRIRISGTVTRASGSTTYKSWVGNLSLRAGKKYLARLTKISGTATRNGADYIPSIAVYESNGASSIANLYSNADSEIAYVFTAPAGAVTLAIFLYKETKLVNYLCAITLEEFDDSGVADQFLAEMEDTVSKVRNEVDEPALVFPWVTDMHRYSSNATAQNFGNTIQNMAEFVKMVPCDFILNTGDLTDGDQTQSMTLARAYDCMSSFRSIGIPLIFVQGNHDTNYAKSGHSYLFTLNQCYQAYFSGTKGNFNWNENGTEFYVDFDHVNTRFISLNANNVIGVEYAYGVSTAAWLSTALNTNKNVILAIHQPPYSTHVYDIQSTVRSDGIKTAISEFINNGGNLLMLTGHSHRDVAFVNPILNVGQDCQRYNLVATEYADGNSGMSEYIDVVLKNARNAEDETFDLWSVCVYKPLTNELSVIRFGGGHDRYFHVTSISPTTVTTKLTGTITWSSSDTSVATVASGVITGVSAGRCAILAKDVTGNYECWIVEVT